MTSKPLPTHRSRRGLSRPATRIAGLCLATLLSPLALACAGPAPAAAEPGSETAQEGAMEPEPPLVVVELFTSQGCSSCPPADRVLSELGYGDGILPLAFHVDYWNRLGWEDPFSSALWSARQQAYARVLPAGRLYTPQAVVQGTEHLVGSRRGQLEEAVAEARREPPRAALEGVIERPAAETVTVTLAAGSPPREGEAAKDGSGPGKGPLEAVVLLVEDGLETEVERGENARRTLRNDHVVRALVPAPLEPGWPTSGSVTLSLEGDWDPGKLRIVALLQDARTKEIYAAWKGGKLPLPAGSTP